MIDAPIVAPFVLGGAAGEAAARPGKASTDIGKAGGTDEFSIAHHDPSVEVLVIVDLAGGPHAAEGADGGEAVALELAEAVHVSRGGAGKLEHRSHHEAGDIHAVAALRPEPCLAVAVVVIKVSRRGGELAVERGEGGRRGPGRAVARTHQKHEHGLRALLVAVGAGVFVVELGRRACRRGRVGRIKG